jgi:hypothetical protein
MKKFHHIGIPVKEKLDNETYLPHAKMYVTITKINSEGIQWMRFEEGAPYPELVLNKPHVAFVVDSLEEVMKGRAVIVAPHSPTSGLTVCMVDEGGIPVEYMCYA